MAPQAPAAYPTGIRSHQPGLPSSVGIEAPPPAGTAVPVSETQSTANTGPLGGNTTIAQVDIDFLTKAAHSGLAEVAAGSLASGKASQEPVKDFARQMVNDHTLMNQQLAQIAQVKGVPVPQAPDAAGAAELDKLRAASGQAFDDAYVQNQITAHQKAVVLFRQQGEQGSDPVLRALARRNVPSLERHLAMAEALPGGKNAVE
ncbi:DUF4142 domain-containing protein [Rhodovastum atsumiense]|uniref:DUF4142 domain-containing protein n=1 Tax=Rhodovastum atsumiense TaxID=504468 RepID=UPI00139F2B07|nr:DUF4142 domain-containing protein [Rhodovastum atsumiense]